MEISRCDTRHKIRAPALCSYPQPWRFRNNPHAGTAVFLRMQVFWRCGIAFAAMVLLPVAGIAQHVSIAPLTTARACIDTMRSLVFANVEPRALLTPPFTLAYPILPAGAATAHYGFFCRQELKWDKALPTQLRFRLGSHEACDRLEGKRRD